MTDEISRRTFVKNSALLGASVFAAPFSGFGSALAAGQPSPSPINAIQVGAASFVDEGVEEVLDILQKRGAVNTVFLNTFSHGIGLAGRQVPGHPYPDHGPQEPDKNYRGGNYAKTHPHFYKNTTLKEIRANEYGDRDIIAEVVKAAKARGMRVFATAEDQWQGKIEGLDECREVDLQGRRSGSLCLLNPNVREFWTALATDTCSTYDIDGFVLFNERNGPLLNALGASHLVTNPDPSKATCFCHYHEQEAAKRNIDFKRLKEGYARLDAFVKGALAGERPSDGYHVTYQRILIEYPEVSAWDKLFDISKYSIVTEVRKAVAAVGKNQLTGLHIEHVNSFNPLFRATRSYEDIAGQVDFLKVVMYNNVGGERYARFIRNLSSTVLRDLPADDVLRFNNQLLGYSDQEGPLDQLALKGLSPDYVYRETRRALAGVKGKCPVLPGIDIGIPTGKNSRKQSPEDVYLATKAAFDAGADGVILSRKYSEMNLNLLDAAGRAIRESVKS